MAMTAGWNAKQTKQKNRWSKDNALFIVESPNVYTKQPEYYPNLIPIS